MFFALFFSVLQICFLPGFIAFVLINKRYNSINQLLFPVFSFGLSLIINYLIVSILAYFHLYTRTSIIILLLIEFVVLTGIFLTRQVNSGFFNFGKTFTEFRNGVNLLTDNCRPSFKSIRYDIFLLSVLLLISLFVLMILNTGKIFSQWDAVFSWNRWAVDFFNNKFPPGTYHYPQLLPANWSISYVLCGWPFQFVPKAMMPLFVIFPVYSLIVLGILQQKPYFFTTALFLFFGILRLNWDDGFVDVPVAFFGIVVFICLSLINEVNRTENLKYILLGSLLACGAAVTKQAGLFILFTFPMLVLLFAPKVKDLNYKRIFIFVLCFLTLIIIIVVPYYLYAEAAIRNGQAESEIRWVTNDIFNGATYPERFVKACILFSGIFPNRIMFVLSIVPFIISLTNKNLRQIHLLFTFPYALIWAFFFSYDMRNSAIIIPFFCLGIGYGVEVLINRFQKAPDIK